MSGLLSRMGVEFGHAAASLVTIESAVGQLAAAAGRADSRLLIELQAIDHLHQTLLALAKFASDIAAVAPDTCRISAEGAVKSLKLHALAKRLVPDREDASAGVFAQTYDFESFD